MNTPTSVSDPRTAQCFRLVRCCYAEGTAELVYAFDAGPELIERIHFPGQPEPQPGRRKAFTQALRLLHWVAGTSYYKAGVPAEISFDDEPIDSDSAALLDTLYRHGLAEFAYRNQLQLGDRIHFPADAKLPEHAASAQLSDRVLVPMGGGKDSLVVVEALKSMAAKATAIWVGTSPLIAACAQTTGLPMLNITRELAPELFKMNRMGAWNGHIPVTAVNSAILVLAALLYDFKAIAFANERSASSATLEYEGQKVNHQWSKSWAFEQGFSTYLQRHVAADLQYFSLLRPYSEIAVTQAFSHLPQYFNHFSSCNRNFRILSPKPADRWCGQCPKCHFVFLALAPFLPKPRLLSIFGHNLLDDESQSDGFDALLEYHQHKPFECVGEGAEARAAMASLTVRSEWREDALVARFRQEILPQLDPQDLPLEPWLQAASEHGIPARYRPAMQWIGGD